MSPDEFEYKDSRRMYRYRQNRVFQVGPFLSKLLPVLSGRSGPGSPSRRQHKLRLGDHAQSGHIKSYGGDNIILYYCSKEILLPCHSSRNHYSTSLGQKGRFHVVARSSTVLQWFKSIVAVCGKLMVKLTVYSLRPIEYSNNQNSK